MFQNSGVNDLIPAYNLALRYANTPHAHLAKRVSESVKIGATVGSLIAFFIVGGIIYTWALIHVGNKTRKMIVETDDKQTEADSRRRGRGHELGPVIPADLGAARARSHDDPVLSYTEATNTQTALNTPPTANIPTLAAPQTTA